MKQVTRIFWLVTLTWLIAACGGGGSLQREDTPGTPTSPSPTTPTTPIVTMTTQLVDSAGNAQTRVAEGAPLSLVVSLSNEDGTALSGELVTFVFSQANLAVFSNDTGTALTNADGVAQINLFVGTLSGSGTVTASINDGPSQTIGFESQGTQQQAPFTLDLFASSTQLASSGSEQIELIAVVKNEQNVLLADIPISFAADQNASLTIVNPVSAEDGTARALLTTSNNAENRTITITSTSGALSESVSVNVVGTEVNINGPSSIILNDSAPITLVLSDSDGNGIAGQEIVLSVEGGQLDELRPITNPNGQISVVFTATESGVAKIEASALGAQSNDDITVQQDDFSFIQLPEKPIELGEENSQQIQLRWLRNNEPFDGKIEVTASRGVISVDSDRTGPNGIATVTISSSFAGPSSISAIGFDGPDNEVTARANLEFIATEVHSIFVDASPDIIGPEGQTATITAIVRDSAGNLVKDMPVNFRLFADSTGGSISPNTALTDSNGIASTVYTSNAVSSIDGVTIEAESDGVTALTNLTVGDRAFDISIGTGNEIDSPDSSTYRKEFAVFVTDAAGRPIANAALTATSTPPIGPAYSKGFWVWNEDARVYEAVVQAVCANEDTNGNGRLDAGEDFNNDGQLTPGNVVSINFKDGISRTDANGQATFDLRYARQFGPWVSTIISLAGQSSGTESSEQQLYRLGVASDDLTEETSPPPANPFGSSSDCSTTL